MKKILVVSGCDMRGESIGLIGKFLNSLIDIEKSFLEISLLDIGFFDKEHVPEQYNVDHYYNLPKKKAEFIIRRIPKLRSLYAEELVVSTFRKLLRRGFYDAVILHHVPAYANRLAVISHKYNSRIIFYPGGSDILRVSKSVKKKLERAFRKADFVVGAINSNTILKAKEIYHVPDSVLKTKPNYLSGVKVLMNIDKGLSREELMRRIGLNYADYNIVCSYNAYPEHRHNVIVEALIDNISVLPDNYQLIFPMTYGGNNEYIEKIKNICLSAGLRAAFLTTFLTVEQLAYLHLITDLFIEIQPTDAGNAFMIEALFSGNTIVTGRWLNYKQFEQFGEPYYLIDKPEDLSKVLEKIFTHQIAEAHVPQELIDMYRIPENYTPSAFWRELFSHL